MIVMNSGSQLSEMSTISHKPCHIFVMAFIFVFLFVFGLSSDYVPSSLLSNFLKWDLLGELSIVIGRAAMSKKLQISHNHWRNGTALSHLQLSLEQDGQVPGSGGKQ